MTRPLPLAKLSPRQEAWVNILATIGYTVTLLPGRGLPAGEAWTKDGVRHIQVKGSPRHPLWFFVLLHEAGHHALGHCGIWTSRPAWQVEYSADRWALNLIKDLEPDTLAVCERASRDHIRPMLQDYIDAEIWNHVDYDVALWAGCTLPPPDRGAA